MFAKDICYALDDNAGVLVLNKKRVNEFYNKHSKEEVFVFGFTFILWTKLVEETDLSDVNLAFKDTIIVHSGGWKKLRGKAVSKEVFSDKISKIFSTHKKNVIDFYGMVEQTGVIFMDCSEGNKHPPNFADVVLRDYYTLKPCGVGQEGLIEVLNAIPDSYPGMSILTEDVGVLLGIDDCKCGRKGKYFRFKNRVENAEIRGCGDTFHEGPAK